MKYKDKLALKITKYCKDRYNYIPKSQMRLGKIYMNGKCHLNTIQSIKEGNSVSVSLCIAIHKDSNMPFVHFINQNKEGKYIDNTLGWIYERYDYYVVKKIDEREYSKIEDVLINTKETLIHLNSNALVRFIFRIHKNII